MPHWSTPEELARDSAVFNNLMHVLVGLYIWEFVISLDFEWKFITGQRRFRWPLFFYFAGRYALLFALVGVLVALEVTAKVNCQALYSCNEIMGNASIGLASINLSVRTMAIWSQSKWVVIPLVIIILGHWALLMQGVLVHAEWEPGVGCVITQTKSKLLAVTFVYSVFLDGIVMCLTACKLAFRVNGRTRLMNLIFQDGLIYFVIAFLSNVLATVFMFLDLNAIMSIIFNVPAAIASTVVASRAVRRLMTFAYAGAQEFTVQGAGTSLNVQFRRPTATTSRVPTIRFPSGRVPPPQNGGVHVQLESFVVADDGTPSPSSYLSKDSQTLAGESPPMESHLATLAKHKQMESFYERSSEYEFSQDPTADGGRAV